MAVKRSVRKFGLQQIGVMRLPAADDKISTAVVNAANSMRQRQFELAKDEAIESGASRAAELDLSSVTTLDETTKLPQAMALAQSMGRFSGEAFEKVLVQRFENSLSSDISAKKTELLAKLADQPNGAALFENSFKDYLDATGANASGYYKQIIVDYGASAMSDGVTRLQVAQIERMRAKAKETQDEEKQNVLLAAFDSGDNGNTFEYFAASKRFLENSISYKELGITTDSEITEFQKQQKIAFLKGKLTSSLQDPELAKQAALISQGFSTGGSNYIYDLLTPKAQGLVDEITNVLGVKSSSEFIEFSNEVNAFFNKAAQSGEIFAEIESAEAAQLKAQHENRIAQLQSVSRALAAAEAARVQGEEKRTKLLKEQKEALIKRIKEYQEIQIDGMKANAQANIDTLNAKVTEGMFNVIGSHANATTIANTISDLEGVTFDSSLLGKEMKASNDTAISNAKAEIAKGIILRASKELNQQQKEFLAEAIKAENFSAINDLMPSLLANQFARVFNSKNKGKISEVVSSAAKMDEIRFNDAQAKTLLLLNKSQLTVLQAIDNSSLSYQDSKEILDQYKENFSGNAFVKKAYIKSLKEFEGKLSSKLDSENNSNFDREAALILTSVNGKNALELSAQIKKASKQYNIDGSKVVNIVQQIMDKTASETILNDFNFGSPEFRQTQLDLMSSYAFTGEAPESLDPKAKSIVDYALRLSTKIDGSKISASKESLSDELTKASGRISEAIRSENESNRKALSYKNATEGKLITNSNEDNVRAEFGANLARAVGLPETPPDLYTKQNLTEQEKKYLQLSKNNRSAVDTVITSNARSLLNGNMPSEQMDMFFVHLRNNFFYEDASGNAKVTAGMFNALGRERSAELETLYRVRTFAPIGQENLFVQDAIENLKQPLSEELFKSYTGYKNAENLVLSLDLPSSIVEDIIPLANAMAKTLGKETKRVLEESLDSRFSENANSYSPVTGGSYIPLDVSFFTDDVEGFENGVEVLVQDLNLQGANLRFEVGNKVSIEEMRQNQAILPIQIVKDVFGNVSDEIAKSRVSSRVLYGPTLDSSTIAPKFQLYTLNEYGMAQVIPNSQFNFNTIEIAAAMGTYMPPVPKPTPTETEPKPTVIEPEPLPLSDKAIEKSLTEEQSNVVQEQVDKRESRTKLKYSPVPTEDIIKPSEQVIKKIGSSHGKGSSAYETILKLDSLPTASAKRTAITKIINETEDLRQTKTRDALLESLYKIRNSLKGK